jgi:hypothetical protein
MRVVTNLLLANRNRQIANILFLVTLAALIGGFALINLPLFTGQQPESWMLVLQSLILPVVFVLTLLSVRQTNLWARTPKHEEALAEALKGLSRKSVLYNYYHFPARHVLIAPQGIFVIVVRWHEGRISVNGDRWHMHKNALSRLLSLLRMDGIGQPHVDAERGITKVKALLADIAPDAPVDALVVFVSPKAQLEIEDPVLPVLYASDAKPNLRDHLRELATQDAIPQNTKGSKQKATPMPLTAEQIQAFEAKTIKPA